jgi:hypothetical protein
MPVLIKTQVKGKSLKKSKKKHYNLKTQNIQKISKIKFFYLSSLYHETHF